MFLNEGNKSNFMLLPFVFITCPCPSYLALSFQRVLEAPLETQDNIRPVREERRKAPSGFEPIPSVPSSSVLIFGCMWASLVFTPRLLMLVQACRAQAARAAAKRGESEGGCAHDAGGLLFSLLISSNLLIPILKAPPRGPAATFYVSPRAR